MDIVQQWEEFKDSASKDKSEWLEYAYTTFVISSRKTTLNLQRRRVPYALNVRFEERLISIFRKEKHNQMLQENIMEALIFWKFVRINMRNEQEYIEKEELREFLKRFFWHGNNFVSIVARFETLPDDTLRKLLWKENIDFMSFESFLRRLEEDQQQVIRKASENFFLPSNADANNPKNIYGNYDRWSTKGAWAFNLLGLDFGFSLFPNGTKNDTQITNKKYSRFLSIKEHINDFIVNQYNGKYWRMYKSARSNYVINASKIVELKPHICPGFWATLGIHLMFWVLSPIFFGATLWHVCHPSSVPAHFSVGTLLLLIASLFPTPIFGFFALIKFTISYLDNHGSHISDFFSGISKSVNGWYKLNKKAVDFTAKGFVKIVVVAICVAILIGLGFASKYYWIGLGKIHVPEIIRVILYPVILFHLVYFIWCKTFELNIGSIEEYSDVPKWVKWFSLASVLIFLTDLYVMYVHKSMSAFFMHSLEAIKNFFVDSTLIAVLIIVSFLITGFGGWLISMALRYEEKFAKYSKHIGYLTWIVGLSLAYSYHKALTGDEMMMYQSRTPFQVSFILGFFAFFALMILWFNTRYINLETLESRKAARGIISILYRRSIIDSTDDRFKRNQTKINFKKFMKNKWLISLNQKKKEEVLESLSKSLHSLFATSKFHANVSMNRFIKNFIVDTDVKKFNAVLRVSKMICDQRAKDDFLRYLDEEDMFYLFEKVLNGKSLSESINLLKQEEKAKRLKKEQSDKAWDDFGVWWAKYIGDPIIWFFKMISFPFVWICRKIAQFFGTLKFLIVLFNERCPFIAKSKVLE